MPLEPEPPAELLLVDPEPAPYEEAALQDCCKRFLRAARFLAALRFAARASARALARQWILSSRWGSRGMIATIDVNEFDFRRTRCDEASNPAEQLG